MPTLTTVVSHFFDSITRFLFAFSSWSSPTGTEKSAPSTEPPPHIVDAFQQYENDIPVRFIDTENLKSIDRDAVSDSNTVSSTPKFPRNPLPASLTGTEKSAPIIEPLPHVTDTSQQYNNDIPVCFIDTENLKFVDRDAVSDSNLVLCTPKLPRTPLPALPTYTEKSAPSKEPLPHITDAFQQYIHNDIPVRFIDTDNLKFVDRDAVFDIFLPDIAQITEEDVEERVHTLRVDMNPESGNYVRLRKMALIDIIRDVVRYAIFSHRWTEGEPMYQDVMTPGRLSYGKQSEIKAAGLAKLIQLCETARSQGYKFVWSDTCCIDKANPTELSEAIHAMFRWYANAHMCIVHLGASSSLVDFESEPWFTRGWTLQELLAPRRIKFYHKDWHPLTTQSNDKDSNHDKLMLALSSVTGIPQDTIIADNSQGIKGRCVWEIMSWASKRKTTRIEDAAYCLFGIFGVHPPIAYGEGDKAFPRLVEEIVAKYRTWDVFAWAGEASKQHAVLPSLPVCYPKWDKTMTGGEVGMTEFALTAHGLRLTSVPLIPVVFESEAKAHDGLYTVMLRPQLRNAVMTAQLGDVRVVCGSNRLLQLRGATNLHVCILNYKPIQSSQQSRGQLQTGRRYICFLLHMQRQEARGEMTWLKFATENVLRTICLGEPSGNKTGRTTTAGNGEFDLPLETTYIREPRAQSTLRI